MKNRAIIAILIAIHAPTQAATITFGMETDLSVSSTLGDLAGATAALGLGNPGQEGANYSITFIDGNNATITRISGATQSSPIGAINTNGLGGETGRSLSSADASLFVIEITTTSTGVVFDSLSWSLTSSDRQHRYALYDSLFAQIGETRQTIGGTSSIAINGGATETDGSGSFNGLIAPNSTAIFYLDTGFNFASGVSTSIVTDSISLNVTPVPEPSVAASLAILSGAALLRRRRILNS